METEIEPSQLTVQTDDHVDVETRKKNIFQKGISSAAKGARKSVKVVGNVWDDFKEFLNRGNVVDLAVGIVIGAAFTAIVTSMVNDLFTPIISLAIGSSSLDNAFVLIACPLLDPNSTFSARGKIGKDCFQSQYTTVALAKSAGAITWNYGSFLQQIINFLIISIIVFFIVKLYTATFRRKKRTEKKEKECSFCCKDIPIKAKLCCYCTSNVENITQEVATNQ
ncbi:hypothetical protein HDV06_001259 [Boothiomyces sp. JEL0866]|nr:hypothetical protein HDV06_001259 [Boothiomyces sp. JEL0866]